MQNNINLVYKIEVIQDLPYHIITALHLLELPHDTYRTTINGSTTQLCWTLSTVPDIFTHNISGDGSSPVLRQLLLKTVADIQ
jgi:hypothetical protein